jgi:ABC-type uncharacterized transport system fused permease/ATPase subunit
MSGTEVVLTSFFTALGASVVFSLIRHALRDIRSLSTDPQALAQLERREERLAKFREELDRLRSEQQAEQAELVRMKAEQRALIQSVNAIAESSGLSDSKVEESGPSSEDHAKVIERDIAIQLPAKIGRERAVAFMKGLMDRLRDEGVTVEDDWGQPLLVKGAPAKTTAKKSAPQAQPGLARR